jgi:chromosome partitioning protein
MDIMQTHICQRISYAETAATGSTVIEEKIKDSLATQEIINLTNEILEKYNK